MPADGRTSAGWLARARATPLRGPEVPFPTVPAVLPAMPRRYARGVSEQSSGKGVAEQGSGERPSSRAMDLCTAAYKTALQGRRLATAGLIASVLLVLGSSARVNFLSQWQPLENDASIAIWQVHAAFTSIGFAGIAIAFQVLADPPLTDGPARRAVIEHLRYSCLLAQGVLANLLLGVVAVWLRSDLNVAMTFALILVPSVLTTAFAYVRLAQLFAHPHVLERLTFDDLKRRTSRALEATLKLQPGEQAFAAAIESRDFLYRHTPRNIGPRRCHGRSGRSVHAPGAPARRSRRDGSAPARRSAQRCARPSRATGTLSTVRLRQVRRQ